MGVVLLTTTGYQPTDPVPVTFVVGEGVALVQEGRFGDVVSGGFGGRNLGNQQENGGEK